MVLVCLPSDALSHLPSYLGFSHLVNVGVSSRLHQQSAGAAPSLGRGVSSYNCPSWAWTWSSSSGPPAPAQQPLLGGGVAPLGWGPWPVGWVSSSLTLDLGKLHSAAAPALSQPGTPGHYPWPWARGSSSWPSFCAVRRSQRAYTFNTIFKVYTLFTVIINTKCWLYFPCCTIHAYSLY